MRKLSALLIGLVTAIIIAVMDTDGLDTVRRGGPVQVM